MVSPIFTIDVGTDSCGVFAEANIHSTIAVKIFISDSASKGGAYRRQKCLKYLIVTAFLPPVGGSIAAINTMSCKYFYSLVSRSNHPPVSIHCRNSSIGGCAPYLSLAGMFRSSMKITMCFLPSSGPK